MAKDLYASKRKRENTISPPFSSTKTPVSLKGEGLFLEVGGVGGKDLQSHCSLVQDEWLSPYRNMNNSVPIHPFPEQRIRNARSIQVKL